MKRRILLAGLFHETNTFAPGQLTLEEFSIALGDEIFTRRGDGSPLGAFLEEAERFGWEIVPTVDLRATPGPRPDPAVLGFFFSEFETRVTREPGALDAIFLVLHGAMAVDGLPDVEGEFLARIRRHPALRDTPIFGVLDLHANFTAAMAENSQGLLAYRENPHTDAAETARRAARLMARSFEEPAALRTAFVPTNIVWPPTGTGTAERPMQTLHAFARGRERDGIEEINVFGGFAHADTPDTGVSFSIVYDARRVEAHRVMELASSLRRNAFAERELGIPFEWDLEAAIDDALAKGLFPAGLVEPADNIGGGAPGDGTAILGALLARKVRGAGVIINDPDTVACLQDKPEGSLHGLSVGGAGSGPGQVAVKARLLRRTDGHFLLEDRQSHLASMSGVHIDMGPSALVDAEGVTILLTSRRTPPMDLGQWRSQGVEPVDLTLIGIKAAVAHRRAYDPILRASYTVRTPGPCTSDLRALSYRRIRRPVYPLDT